MDILYRLLLFIITAGVNVILLWILFLSPLLGVILYGAEAFILWKILK